MYDEQYYRSRENTRDFHIEARLLYELLDVRPGSRVLEVGCGGGAFLAFLEGLGHPAVGIDILEDAVAAARKSVSSSRVLQADAGRLPFEDSSFDRLVTHHLVEHLSDLPSALADWGRVLAPGGVIAICTPNRMYENPLIFDDPEHVHIYDRRELAKAVERAGFRVERCFTVFPGLGSGGLSIRAGVPLYRLFYRLPYFRDRGRSILLSARKRKVSMPKTRVLFVNHAVPMGGAENALLGMLTWLDRERFEAGLALPFEGPLAEEARKAGVKVHIGYPSPRLLNVKRRSLGENRLAILAYPFDMAVSIARMVRLIRRERYDLVMSNSSKAHIYGSISGWASGRPVAWRLHDILTTEAFSRLNVSVFKFCARLFLTKVVAASRAIANAVESFGVPRSKLAVVFNGTDISAVRAEPAAGAAVREEFGIAPDAPVAGIIGRLIEWKGVDYFIKAAALVSESLPDARFLVVGDALYGSEDYIDGLKKLSCDLGLDDRLIFTGFRDDVPAIISASDVLVYASVQPEPSGLGVNEALAGSRPVVGTDHGGLPELVEDGVSGVMIPPRDAGAMAKALIELLSDNRKKARSMGEAGLVRAREKFDPARQMRAIEEQFLDMLGERR